jgi:hypothetical protein
VTASPPEVSPPAPDPAEASAPGAGGLWPGDTGSLAKSSRQAFLQLLRGPYLSSERHPALWNALLADRAAIASRLADLFVDLIVDSEAGLAFIRTPQSPEEDLPKAVRSNALTFMDTIMVLALRQKLTAGNGVERVFVDRAEIFEQLGAYQGASGLDDADFLKRMGASWTNMAKYGLIHASGGADRVEISPALRIAFGIEEVRAIREEYRKLTESGGSLGPDTREGEADDDVA